MTAAGGSTGPVPFSILAAAKWANEMPDGRGKALVVARALAWRQFELRPEDFQREGVGPLGMRHLAAVMDALVRDGTVSPSKHRGPAAMWRSRVVPGAPREPEQVQLNLRGQA